MLIAVVSIVQRHWAMLWIAVGFAILGWLFITRDTLEIEKSLRRVTCRSLRPTGLRTTRFGFEDISDVIFETNGVYFRPALATASGLFQLTKWYSAGSPSGSEHVRLEILVALGKVRPGLI